MEDRMEMRDVAACWEEGVRGWGFFSLHLLSHFPHPVLFPPEIIGQTFTGQKHLVFFQSENIGAPLYNSILVSSFPQVATLQKYLASISSAIIFILMNINSTTFS